MPIMILTCETDGCQNFGIPIELATDATQFMCGACMTLITNSVEKSADAGTTKK